MLKIVIIAIITIFISVILKQKLPDFSMMVNVCGSLLIFISCFEYLKEIVSFYFDLGSTIGIGDGIIKPAIKILGVGYLAEFVSNLAEDFGNSVISSKVIFGGKVVICLITLPIIKELVYLLLSFL